MTDKYNSLSLAFGNSEMTNFRTEALSVKVPQKSYVKVPMKNKKLRNSRRSYTTKQSLLRVRKSEIIEHKKHVSYKPPVEIHKHLYKQLEKNTVNSNPELKNMSVTNHQLKFTNIFINN